jgi:GGDEF domain-containing protein
VKELLLLPGSLRAKFIAAIGCMSVLPFLVCLYIVTTFVFPYVESIWLTSAIILITMLIAICGYNIMQEIVDNIVRLSGEARRMAERSCEGTSVAREKDEMATLKSSLSALAEDVERKSLRVKQLEVMDERVGIYTESYVRQCLTEELKRATLYQRPCSIMVAQFKRESATDMILSEQENTIIAVSALAAYLKRFAEGIEKIGRLGISGICLVLPERNKGKAVEMAEKIKAAAAAIPWGKLASFDEWKPELLFSVATAPIDGVDPGILLKKCLGGNILGT